MRIGVLSDTHGAIDTTRRAVRMLESLEVDQLLHCGDIGSTEIVQLLSRWSEVHYVFGNCDYDRATLRQAILEAGHYCHEEFAQLTLDGVAVALLHSHDERAFNQACEQGAYRLVCYGHTHRAALERIGETLVMNPGALYRTNQPSIAVVDLPRIEATLIDV